MTDRDSSTVSPKSHQRGTRRPPRDRGLQTTTMSVYLSSDEPPPALLRALGQLVRAVDLTTVHESDVERGSWFRSWRMRETRPGGLHKLGRLARKAERAGELKYIHGVRAESDEHEANAVATVIRSLAEVDSAVIHLSSMIIVKFQGRLICRVMSEREISVLQDHPELLRSPGDLFLLLSRMISDETERRRPLPNEDDPFGMDTRSAPPVIGL